MICHDSTFSTEIASYYSLLRKVNLAVMENRVRFASKCFYFLASILRVFKKVFELIKWEYKVVPIKTQIHTDHFQAASRPIMDDVQKDLSDLGNEGWELVAVQDISLPDGRMFTVAYLKRQTSRA
jgi:hypothetical protein